MCIVCDGFGYSVEDEGHPLNRYVLAILVSVVAICAAQTRASAVETRFKVAGVSMKCTDFRGRSVVGLEVSDLGDVGRAWVVNTVPYILLDPELMRPLPKPLQVFFYLHECAHHVLGHWYNPTISSENEADCWAIVRGRDRKLFRRQEVVDFAPWLAKSGGSRFGHLPGPERLKKMLVCFDTQVETAQQN